MSTSFLQASISIHNDYDSGQIGSYMQLSYDVSIGQNLYT